MRNKNDYLSGFDNEMSEIYERKSMLDMIVNGAFIGIIRLYGIVDRMSLPITNVIIEIFNELI